MHCEEHRGHIEQRDRGEKERGRNTVSTMDEAASTTDALGFVNSDGAPINRAQPLTESRQLPLLLLLLLLLLVWKLCRLPIKKRLGSG